MQEHLFALSVHAYHAGELDVGQRACEKLLSMPLSRDREELVRRNRTWYTRGLTALMPVSFHRFDIQPAHEGWSLFNPTIASCGDGFLAIVRSSNYTIREGRYETPESDRGLIRTENLLCRLSRRLEVDDVRPIRVDYPKTDFPVDGLEDCRLDCRYTLDYGMRWTVSGTILNHLGFDGTARIATGRLNILTGEVSELVVRHEPIPGRHEKNWMPFFGGASTEFLYAAWEDGRVATAKAAGGEWMVTKMSPSPAIARGFRGGTQLVRVDGGWLGIVHEVAADTGGRIYEHRWIRLDNDRALVGISEPFFFREHRVIEFAAGLAMDDDDLVVTFGVRDAEAWAARVTIDDVLRVTEPLDIPEEDD